MWHILSRHERARQSLHVPRRSDDDPQAWCYGARHEETRALLVNVGCVCSQLPSPSL